MRPSERVSGLKIPLELSQLLYVVDTRFRKYAGNANTQGKCILVLSRYSNT